jgi:hypothetical protein
MRELIHELAIDIANHGFGIFDTSTPSNRTIYVGELPQGVAEGLLLVAVPSPPPHQYVDTEYPVIDIWAVSPHTDRAYALLRQIFNTYHRRYDWDTTNWHVYFSQALGNIEDVDRDREGGKLFRLSVQFISRNINNIS